MPKCIPLKIFRKSTKNYELIFTEDGSAKNITGWTIYFTVKTKVEDTDANARIKKDITSHSDPVNGKTMIELYNTDTDLSGNLHYSVDYKDDQGNEGVLFYGKINFVESVRDTR